MIEPAPPKRPVTGESPTTERTTAMATIVQAARPVNRLDHDHCERRTPHTPHVARWHQHVETWCDGRP